MARRAVVVKIGSSTLVDAAGRPRPRVYGHVAGDVASLAEAGTPVVVVSSGAIALGLGTLGRAARSGRLRELQAASAVGQQLLQQRWQRALGRHGLRSAQVLLTVADVHRRQTYVNARRTLETLLRWGAVPVVNENDSTATDEITFGDNDALAAHVALLLGARLLVLLTDTPGLYDREPGEPGARLIREVRDHHLLEGLEVGRRGSAWGSGGMRSKVLAAEMASAGGIQSVIASGRRAGTLAAAAAGEVVGTRFRANPSPLPAYKLWLRYGKPVAGRVIVDSGARHAIERRGTSLLPVGVIGVEGSFEAGDAVELYEGGDVFAIGVANQPAAEMRDLAGARGVDEVVHRDNLVVL